MIEVCIRGMKHSEKAKLLHCATEIIASDGTIPLEKMLNIILVLLEAESTEMMLADNEDRRKAATDDKPT